MKIYLPYPKNKISQKFGVNATAFYASQGLKGHTAYDWDVPHGTPVSNCAENAFVYSVLNQANPDPSKYRAVYTLIEDETGVYEVSYGHFSKIYAEVGKIYQPGETLGLVGNTGAVYSGDRAVTVAERKAGSKAGSHLHGPQIRPCKKVKKIAKGKVYLRDAKGTLKKDGFYVEVLNHSNGYNGCVSLAPYSTESLAKDWKPPVKKEVEVAKGLEKAVGMVNELPEKDRLPWYEKILKIALELLQIRK